MPPQMNKTFRRRLLIAMLALAAQAPLATFAEDSPVKDAAKQAGRDAKAMGKQVGKTAKQVGQDIGKASRRTFNTIRQEFRKDALEGSPGNSPPGKNAGGRS
jgi:hypothetical protein